MACIVYNDGVHSANSSNLGDELPSLDEATTSVDALVSDEPLSVLLAAGLASAQRSGQSAPPGFHTGYDQNVNASRSASIYCFPRHAGINPEMSQPAFVPPYRIGTSEHIYQNLTVTTFDIKTQTSVSGRGSQVGPSPKSSVSDQVNNYVRPDEDFPALDAPKEKKRSSNQNCGPAFSAVPTPKATPTSKSPIGMGQGKCQHELAETAYTGLPVSRGDKETLYQKSAISSFNYEGALLKTEKLIPPPIFPPPSSSSITNYLPATNRSTPRSLRVVHSLPKSDTKQNFPIPTTISLAQSATSKTVSTPQRPDTPASEMISDAASVVSLSFSASRASSPPSGRGSTTHVRITTKSQQRKQRKEALKQEAKLMVDVPMTGSREHAPVVGRKKKQKKERSSQETTSKSHILFSVNESLKEEAFPSDTTDQDGAKPQENGETAQKNKPAQLKGSENPGSKENDKGSKEAAQMNPVISLPRKTGLLDLNSSKEKPLPGPSSVFAEIRRSLWTLTLDKLHILKIVSGIAPRSDFSQTNSPAKRPGYCKDCACKCGEIQDDDLAALRAGRPVRKQFHVDGSRMLITPNGDCIRGLSPEEENVFLDLQAAIAVTAENPGAFIAPRHQPGSGAFSLIKGRAVPNGRPTIFPSTPQLQSQDPIGKLQREDALSYINQYVLPRLSLGVNNLGLPKGTCTSRDSTAASLNSLAPYFYGPDAAAGVGIYSTPDGARALQDLASPIAHGEESDKGTATGVGNMPLMSVEDAESALTAARKEAEKLEKGLNAVIRRNKRLLLGYKN